MTLTFHISLCSMILAASACGNAFSGGDSTQATASNSVAADRSDTSLRIEQAERQLETGRDVAGARTTLTSILRDSGVSGEDRDRAALAGSRAEELSGDKEAAIRAVEELLAAHGDTKPWALESATEKRLRKLLTGDDSTSPAMIEGTRHAVAPIAHKLATYFPENASRGTDVRILRFGGISDTSARLGTFNLGGAKHDEQRAACPLCEDDKPTHTHESGYSWTGIPTTRVESTTSLEIFYFDLRDELIPARYDDRLPMPSAQIVERLKRGEGVIAVRERGSNPPVILIAAPHWGQLADVEEKFANMTELPKEPVSVAVMSGLRPEEIQATVRGSFGRFRACYEQLLVKAPTATGKVAMAFTIDKAGAVSEARIDAGTTLLDATLDACMLDAVKTLTFPSPSPEGSVTVVYPVLFSPGN